MFPQNAHPRPFKSGRYEKQLNNGAIGSAKRMPGCTWSSETSARSKLILANEDKPSYITLEGRNESAKERIRGRDILGVPGGR